jgi:hypothetical protein
MFQKDVPAIRLLGPVSKQEIVFVVPRSSLIERCPIHVVHETQVTCSRDK